MSRSRLDLPGIAVLAFALCLAPGRSDALPTMVVSSASTRAEVDGAIDSDDPGGPVDVESYVEEKDQRGQPFAGPYTWFASAVSGPTMLNQVGVDLTKPYCCVLGNSTALTTESFLVTNDTDQPLVGLRSGVVIPAGEILFQLGNIPPQQGDNRGGVSVQVFAEGLPDPIFRYQLDLVTTDGGFEELASSTANVPIDLVFNGQGGTWGYTLAAGDFDFTLPTVPAHGQLELTHVMEVYGFNGFLDGEAGAGLSVKLGDPLKPLSGRTLFLVPESGSFALLGLGVAGLGAGRAWRARARLRGRADACQS